MNRRDFLRNSAILTAGAAIFKDYPSFAKVIKAKGEPNIRIGIVSDVHFDVRDADTADTFRHTLEYFRDRKVDGVLVAGDIADRGLEPELQLFADTWYSVFPGDKRPDGEHVEKLFIYGNHDVNNWSSIRDSFEDKAQYSVQHISEHREATWKRCFKEEFEPITFKTVKGYHFIGAHWCDGGSIDGLAEFMGKHHGKLAGTKPFFYYQHPHPKNTCNGPWAWGQDNGTVTDILSHYPNAVAFSGHSHCPLTDERDLWQGTFTSIGTSSLRYQYPIGARENQKVDGGPKEKSEMPEMGTGDGRQGMLMSVYDDCIAIEKREFVYDEPLRESWIIPLGVGGTPMSFEERAKTAQIPQFNPLDKATVTRAMGKDRQGDEHMQLTVHFPSVLKKTHGVRAFDYEVQVEARYVDVIKSDVTKRVYSPKCYLGEKHDSGEVICVFAETELPLNYEVRFAVRPCECFGGKGNPIYTDWMPARTLKK